jgi:hypothetical protein
MFDVTKDPEADLDYGFDWTSWLAGDTITTSTWTVPSGSGLSMHSAAIAGNTTLVWLSGGTRSAKGYTVTNHIETAAGRKDDRSMCVVVVDR